MGGKNCAIVDSDADLDEVVPDLVASAFAYAGQKCSAASRLLVHEAVADQLLERLAGAIEVLQVGPAQDFATDVPALIERRGAGAGRRATPRRGRVRAGCSRPLQRCPSAAGTARRGCSPTSIPAAPLLREEVFGPLLTAERVADIEQAFEIVESLPFALTGGLYSRRPETGRRGDRATAGRQPIRQPRDHRRPGRPAALRRQPPLRCRLQGRRPRLPAPVHRAAGRDRERHAARDSDGVVGPGSPARTASSWAAIVRPTNSASAVRKAHSSRPIIPASGP